MKKSKSKRMTINDYRIASESANKLLDIATKKGFELAVEIEKRDNEILLLKGSTEVLIKDREILRVQLEDRDKKIESMREEYSALMKEIELTRAKHLKQEKMDQTIYESIRAEIDRLITARDENKVLKTTTGALSVLWKNFRSQFSEFHQ